MKFLKINRKLQLRKCIKKEYISIYFFLIISIWFFSFFELLLLSVFSNFLFLDFRYILFWQTATICINIIIFNLGIRHRNFRMLYFSTISFISGAAIIFLSSLKSLIVLKTLMIILFLIGIIGNYLCLKFSKKKKNKKIKSRIRKIRIFLILILSFLAIISIFNLTIPENKIIIKPKTNPELIFWTDPYDLPDEESIYELCRTYNIGFMPAINARTLNKSSLMDKYKLAIAHGVNLYFCLLTSENPFINMDNTDEYLPLYERFKQWFIEEGIFESSFVKAFVVDAEPPVRYTEEIREESFVSSINYFIENYPTKEEIKDATENVDNLVKEIQSDGKKAGIIRITPYLDELDGDGDIELFIRNIYSLDIVWDFSVTMIYRVGAAIVSSGDTVEDVSENVKQNVFGQIKDEKINILSAYNFYFRVGMCKEKSGSIRAANHYIFIGTLKKLFNDTDYMENKEYLDDLDICRHFGKEKVFLYDFQNFINNYGKAELINLGKHNQQKDSWELEYLAVEVQVNILFYLALAFLDRLLYLDQSN